MIESLVWSGRIVDLALVVLALEVALVAAFGRRLAGRSLLVPVLWNAGAGAGLLLALRAALTGGSTLAVVLPLTLALVCHVGESLGRLKADRP
ncbi:hypothetical protein [Mongoliimonas terrestris]|uniref:hypothetical protein n=1 Tax=Mongoliimonas terrestris TaxID=1709001 RepID=UPI0009F9DAF9|nr:hypothetical protein [Mongoliimonas terrestris]